jgi:hypothetical protein
MATSPYKLQIFVPDEAVREAMKEVVHREKTSLQKLTVDLWLAKLHEYPEFQHLALGDKKAG